ncbi:AAA family ATPase [Arthrobacter sp. BE255]|uniref:helix-turn-helix transcriptional regulator n=1 Tax=Arthrobacter sp. BE255 TaxID=2817721 RepID=UPI00285F069B|nr:AAA family ATPase [Arthrobacter sp. BE255]MDR7159010.1 DNA-binding CsgD family transcriptional regulator/tetratricopeptide (TPR) repeat protein [Arthrobacter sp. BE255]
MAKPLDTGGPDFIGRAADLAELAGVIGAVRSGTARTFIISGDAGVGKTALVAQACAAAHPEVAILKGAALPLASMEMPLLALRGAFRSAGAARFLAPSFPRDAGPELPLLIDEWLTGLSLERPVLLVVDDLQWADQTTLDVLMYLVAGPQERRLGVIGTVRHNDVGDGHKLDRWLADIRRLPGVDTRTLAPLDRPDTEAQLASILGEPPHRTLVNDVFARSAGNPYLNLLLVAGLSAGDRHLPAGFPPDLKSAVLRSWQGLPSDAQELTRIMAVGGKATTGADLREVAGPAFDPERIPAVLRSAAEAGILDLAPDGTYWFHHPLIAETLELALDAVDRTSLHSAFAAYYERQLDGGTRPEAAVVVSLADHHHQAGHQAEAYRWALVAADAARQSGANGDALRMLSLALDLRRGLPDAAERTLDLWDRVRQAAYESGALSVELESIEALLGGTDLPGGALARAELMVRRMHLQLSTGQGFFPLPDIREAVRLSAAEPHSWQHALALAELSHATMWHNEPGVEAPARQALALARETGDHRALSYALTAVSIAENVAGRPHAGIPLAEEGAKEALRARDFWAFVHATAWAGNANGPWTSAAYADLMHRARQELVDRGAPHAYTAKIAADEAASFLAVGDWRKCRAALRIAIGFDPGPMGDVSARLTAARLAALQGRRDEAAVHLQRAEELYDETSGLLNLDFDAIRAEVSVAAGRPEAAFEAAITGATGPGPPPTMCEWLLPVAARALADQVQRARDLGAPTSGLLAAANDLQDRFPGILHEPVGESELYRRQLEAFELLYAAELGRARIPHGNAPEWAKTADALRHASLPWEEAYACQRAVESLLLHGHSPGHQAAELLRRGLALAVELQAAPVREALEGLAARARIPVATMAANGQRPAAVLPGLTPRELDILDHVVAGRTYGEIARALVISEKTVSSHISNLLRKTGAANRLDLARLASAGPPAGAPVETPR